MLTDANTIFFISSSGHCNLDCEYCIINPIVKHRPSLNFDDISYLLDSVEGKSALLFSGKGDFFAGYKKNDRLLSKILERDVDVGLDINGVIIHEFAELTDAQVGKVMHINLSMHYTQIKRKHALSTWAANANLIFQRWNWPSMLMNMILSALPDLVGLLYHVNQQLENRLSLKPHLDVVDNDI
jgi:MoaA/NifB/PqqE/SkfB family radical SAM enzyme